MAYKRILVYVMTWPEFALGCILPPSLPGAPKGAPKAGSEERSEEGSAPVEAVAEFQEQQSKKGLSSVADADEQLGCEEGSAAEKEAARLAGDGIKKASAAPEERIHGLRYGMSLVSFSK